MLPEIIEYGHGLRKKAITERDDKGVTYSVEKDGVVIWAKRVEFGHDVRHRAGGPAFVEASREQDEVVANA